MIPVATAAEAVDEATDTMSAIRMIHRLVPVASRSTGWCR